MSINRAICRLEEDEEVWVDEIAEHENYLEIRDNLYCHTNDCNCRLIYIPRGRKRAYLKKWNGDNHIESCEHYAVTQNEGRTRRIIGTNTSTLRPSHIASILRDVDSAFMESEDEQNARLNRNRENYRRRRANQRVNTERANPPEIVVINQPTTASDGEVLSEGERNPPVRRRVSILDFSDADIGETQATAGYITDIQNNERQTIITITDRNNRAELCLYLEEVFFSTSHENTSQLLVQLKNIVEYGIEIRTICVGQVISRNDSIGMLVLNAGEMSFNRLALASVIFNTNIQE